MKPKVLDTLNWKQIDKEHIEVTFHGHFDDNFAGVESQLNRAGLHAESRHYDRLNNRTVTIYKRTIKAS